MKPQPFVDLLILDMINRFIFGHGVLIYYVIIMLPGGVIWVFIKSNTSVSSSKSCNMLLAT